MRTPRPAAGDDDALIDAWRSALGARGLSVEVMETGDPGAPWGADAVDASGDTVANGMGDNVAEAVEVLVWNMFGHDLTSDGHAGPGS